MAPASHTRKKQFQAPITSYFERSCDGFSSHGPSLSLSPPLPEETQAGLISVGMRVRKSVPEGYKTCKTVKQAEFVHPSSAPASTTPLRGFTGQGSSRELMPFCGLHKTGGWAMQTMPSSSAPSVLQSADGADDLVVADLSASQATMASTQDSFMCAAVFDSNSKKRTYEDEAEDDLDDIFEEIDRCETSTAQDHPAPRRIAKARKPFQKLEAGSAVHIVKTDDFEEASFLAPSDGMDVDY